MTNFSTKFSTRSQDRDASSWLRLATTATPTCISTNPQDSYLRVRS